MSDSHNPKAFLIASSIQVLLNLVNAFNLLASQSLSTKRVLVNGKRFPSPSIAAARDSPKTGEREVISEDVYVIGGCTVEQPLPSYYGTILTQIENIPPSRMFEMHRMKHGISYMQQLFLA